MNRNDSGTSELEEKERRLHDLMSRRGLDAVLLQDAANAAWLSGGGRTYIHTATESGVGSLLITRDARYLLTDVIEAERLRDEESFGSGWEIVAEPWQSAGKRLPELTTGLKAGSDRPREGFVDIGDEVARLRWHLLPIEVERYRALGRDAGEAIGEAARAARPGMTEYELAALVASAAYRRGALPVVVLIATDERLQTRRHALPTGKKMERSAMLVLCARRDGLVASCTRLVHAGEPPEEMRRGMRAVANIDAAAVLSTRPGVRAGDIFAQIQRSYSENGYPGEWRYHHQGGAAGYAPRDYVATPATEHKVEAVQAFAWNPSVPGAKSEDTFLVTQAGPELLTPSPGWPQQIAEFAGVKIERPGVLVIER